ncbi:hypothetical protein FRAAL5072 [Frankia alni ACN14a]|uniref:Uncharacterized protein n=1 Tax=Frankia alni (strain DSM 45986 / CECT 9034 / ACN14a) TaxID=326424 RepID=Q0RFN0_FRAAA|nr:hypothetical protein FRAAL5072 [Frankia alni ACN14a]
MALRPAARERDAVGAPDGETTAGAGAVAVAAVMGVVGVDGAVGLGRCDAVGAVSTSEGCCTLGADGAVGTPDRLRGPAARPSPANRPRISTRLTTASAKAATTAMMRPHRMGRILPGLPQGDRCRPAEPGPPATSCVITVEVRPMDDLHGANSLVSVTECGEISFSFTNVTQRG